MKIAHVTSDLSRRGGGIVAVVEQLSATQNSQGADVAVFGLNSQAWSVTDSLTWNGAAFHACSVHGPDALGFAPDMLGGLLEWNPDVVHLHGMWMYPSRAVVKWHCHTRKPFMISTHGMLSDVALSYSSWKKRAAMALFQKKTFQMAFCLHATSSNECEEIRSFGLSHPISLFNNGISDMIRPLDLEVESTNRLLSLGRIHRKKGLDRLVEAWSVLEPEYSKWSLDIVGPEEDGHGDYLRELISKFGLKRAVVRGPLYGLDKERCVAGAGLFVLPSLSENFGLTVGESLMLEVPVISTRGAPWEGLASQGCGLWIEHGTKPLIGALRQIMSMSKEERRKMGKRGREWMLTDYSWGSVSRRSLQTYDWMIGNGTAPKSLR